MEEIRRYQFIDSWCIINNILIYAVPIDNKTLRIEINNKGKIKTGELIFNSKDRDAWERKIRELRQTYFDFYNLPENKPKIIKKKDNPNKTK